MDYLRVMNHAGSTQLQITNQVLPWMNKHCGDHETGRCSFALDSRGMHMMAEILEEVLKGWKLLVYADHLSLKNM